ncbi:YadA C-terminal domain-containing protein [Salmonella enterica subsp. enterica serovar Bareilly]
MKKTVLAVIVAMTAASAAHASNADVNTFIENVKGGEHMPLLKDMYSKLNARDKMVVDSTYTRAGISPAQMADIRGGKNVLPAKIEGWNQNATFRDIHPLAQPVKPTATEVLAASPELQAKRAAMIERANQQKMAANIAANNARLDAYRAGTLTQVFPAPAPAAPAGIVSYEDQLDQLNRQHFAALKAGADAATIQDIVDRINVLKAEKAEVDQEVAKRAATHAAVQAGQNRVDADEAAEEVAKRETTHAAVAAQVKDEEAAEAAKVVATHQAVAAQVKDEENAEAAKVVATHIAVQAQTKDEENAEKAKVVAVQNAIQAGKNKAETSAKGDEEVMGLLSSNQERTASQHVDGVAAQAADNATAIKTEKAVRTQQFNVLADGVAVAQATGEYAQSRADAAYANTQENRRALDNTNKRVAQNSADIADHEQRITSLEQSTTSKFGALKNEVEQNRKRASAGIAGVAAMANIPQVTQGATFSVGAGVGNTDGESALAVGASARINDSWVVKGSVSNDTQHNFVVGAGASYQW